MTNAVECDSSPISINDINAGNTAEISFELSVQENAYVGRIAQFYADLLLLMASHRVHILP